MGNSFDDIDANWLSSAMCESTETIIERILDHAKTNEDVDYIARMFGRSCGICDAVYGCKTRLETTLFTTIRMDDPVVAHTEWRVESVDFETGNGTALTDSNAADEVKPKIVFASGVFNAIKWYNKHMRARFEVSKLASGTVVTVMMKVTGDAAKMVVAREYDHESGGHNSSAL